MSFRSYMHIALYEARARRRPAVKYLWGAVVVNATGQVVAQAGNRTRELNDPSAHAEMLAIRAACQRLGQERLANHDLYVTLEPCPMCAGFDRCGAYKAALLRSGRCEIRRVSGRDRGCSAIRKVTTAQRY